jgi:hypothetical protein
MKTIKTGAWWHRFIWHLKDLLPAKEGWKVKEKNMGSDHFPGDAADIGEQNSRMEDSKISQDSGKLVGGGSGGV